MSAVAVVGAGRTGLQAAAALARAGRPVALFERLPAAGGQEPEPETAGALAADARRVGVELRLGTLAVRWDGEALHALGVDGAVRFECAALLVATGTRPATRGELGIAGDRFAGVMPGSAALHLTESGVLLGHRPVVLGGGTLAGSCVGALRHAGAEHVTLVAPDGVLDPAAARADSVLEGWTVHSASGDPRVSSVTIARGDGRERLAADALVLAHRRVPMRNVEGAVRARECVVFCHSGADPKTAADARAAAERGAGEVLETLRRGAS